MSHDTSHLVRLRLPDPSSQRRLAAFLRSLGVETTLHGETGLEPAGEVDPGELAIYLRVWNVLHPDATVTLEE